MTRSLTLDSSEFSRGTPPSGKLSEWDDVLREESAGRTSLLGPVMAGLATLIVGVGGFFLWASATPIAQASVAHGRVIVESNTKTVSHLEGGTLARLVVSEGVAVKQGELLAVLDSTRSHSSAAQLHQQLFVLDVRMARLTAEKDEAADFDFDGPAPKVLDSDTAALLVSTEKKLFQERRSQFIGQIAAEQSMLDQLKSQREALIARRKSWAEQAEFIRRDFEAISGLEEKKLATKAASNEKKIQLVDMESRIAESDSAIAENSQRQTQARLSLANRRTDYFRVISEQIQSAQSDIARIRQEIIAAEDVVSKADIRAPQDGIVANIRVRTTGSAVIAGQPILDIVPDNQPMVIEGRARAADIDTIRIGEKAEIHLSAFGSAELKPLIAHVVYIAPDGIADERTGEISYVFRAKIDDAEMKKQPNLFLYPGMSAEVFIVSGNRTALAYLALPITKSFTRAFREQ